ncbi:MAG: hypothetical protein RLZZ70_762 [Candidatus Parcubacteria bacterium]
MKILYSWLPRSYGPLLIACMLFIGGSLTPYLALAGPITPGSFSTTWKTDNPGVSGTNQITIPTTGGGYNYNVYWEEVGNDTNNGSSTGHTGDLVITFPSVGTYRVDITGTFPQIQFTAGGGGDRLKILTVEQWGSISWRSFNSAFRSAGNLQVLASDTPDLSMVTNLGAVFSGVASINSSISNWDVSNVTVTGSMFFGVANFNQPLDNWDVSNVTDMSLMFNGAVAFNQPLNSWNVGSVTNMTSMFQGAVSFNQPLSNWNVSNVTNMEGMFNSARAFNQPLNNWNVGNVTRMGFMFYYAEAFNQPLNNWNVGNVTNMEYMFTIAESFNQPLSNWNVANVTNMEYMFNRAESFNQPLNNWNVANVTNMMTMFAYAEAFNQPLNNWNVANVTNMTLLFDLSTNFSSASYSNTLIGWSNLPSLQSNVNLTSPAAVCSTASSSRATLISTYNWTINDLGFTDCYTVVYAPGVNATLIGVGSQIVESGSSGSSVQVIPDSGYQFVSWSDGNTNNPRTDVNVMSNISVSAVVTAVSSSGGGGSGGGSSSRQRTTTLESASSSPVISTSSMSSIAVIKDHSSFLASVAELLVSLDVNQAAVASMPAEERQRIVVLLQSIVVYLMSLLVELQF